MDGYQEESMSMNLVQEPSMEMDEMAFDAEGIGESHNNGNDMWGSEEDREEINEEGLVCDGTHESIIIDGLQDIVTMDLKNLNPHDVSNFEFLDLEVAYVFYSWYARANGFAARKAKVLRNNKGEIVQQTFVCFLQGYREDRGLTMENRRREPKPETRCGCKAKFRVHVLIGSGRWYVTYFTDEHNHKLLEEKYCEMLPAHRKMTAADIMQMNNLRKIGISVPHIYSSFANHSGGYQKIGFRKKDIYNQIGRQRRLQSSDANGALEHLQGLAKNDKMMFFRHTVDEEGRLQHLFWCDGISQIDYQVFGDVLAFDATYGKNKYRCPFVVFSGVNNHNRTTVFASAIIRNETEETYVWLLEQFNEAMKGKTPTSIITDGDIAMKNAINKVFPNAHHRLCAWHLIRNATTNVGIPAFTAEFKKCMLIDYDVVVFDRKWNDMVSMFGLEENNWLRDMYKKRKMWATSHIRGNFFAGLRTTSRCEGLHSQIAKFVHSRMNLTDFVHQFHRCLTCMRFNEGEDDFASAHGEAVLQTNLHSLERSASRQFTRNIFLLFRPVLSKASLMYVVGCKEMVSYSIYTVSKYGGDERQWNVYFYEPTIEIKCSCQRMESYGLPCGHIVAVLVYLNIAELPKSLVLNRWSKNAKEIVRGGSSGCSNYWESHLMSRYVALLDQCKELCSLAYCNEEDFYHIREIITYEIECQKEKRCVNVNGNSLSENFDGSLRDPPRSRCKGFGPSSTGGLTKSKRLNRCSVCKDVGHNKKSCPIQKQTQKQTGDMTQSICDSRGVVEDEDTTYYNNELNEDLSIQQLNDRQQTDAGSNGEEGNEGTF